VRESCTFSGHPYIGRIARLSLRQHGFLVIKGPASPAVAGTGKSWYSAGGSHLAISGSKRTMTDAVRLG